VLLEAGQEFVALSIGKDDAVVSIDRTKIISVGVPAIAKFLQKIQVYKTTADVDAAQHLYHEYTDVNEKFIALREIVLAKKTPRSIFVQASTYIDSNGEVQLQQYPSTTEGVVQSFIAHFS